MTLTPLATGARDQLAGTWRRRADHGQAAGMAIATAALRKVPGSHAFVSASHGGVPASTLRAALSASGCQCERVLPTVSDTAVLMVSSPCGQPGVLKVASTASGMASVGQEREMLARLWAEERLVGWRDLLPAPLAAGYLDDGVFLLVSRLTGRDGRQLQPAATGQLTTAAIGAIAPLHRLGQAMQVPGPDLLDSWVNEPAARIAAAAGGHPAIGRMTAVLRAELGSGPVPVGWTHGDFYPGNVLVGDGGQVTGIIDWSQARPLDLVPLDLAFWLLAGPAPGQPRDLGRRVAARLASGRYWTPAEGALLQAAMPGLPATGRSLLVLAWLRHVTANLAKSARYASSPFWSRRNILPVLRQLDEIAWAGEGP
jgi:aminoglycoside phosphotransferase (APT) family kinase protein